MVQATIGFVVALPILLDASGISETLPGIGLALAASGFVTRLMDVPQVQELLRHIGMCDSPDCQRRQEDEEEPHPE